MEYFFNCSFSETSFLSDLFPLASFPSFSSLVLSCLPSLRPVFFIHMSFLLSFKPAFLLSFCLPLQTFFFLLTSSPPYHPPLLASFLPPLALSLKPIYFESFLCLELLFCIPFFLKRPSNIQLCRLCTVKHLIKCIHIFYILDQECQAFLSHLVANVNKMIKTKVSRKRFI